MIRIGLVFMCLGGMILPFPARGEEVLSGKEPGNRRVRLVFEEELRFGGQGPNHEWQGVNPCIQSDAEGNIYIADTGNNRILAFDSDGKFTREIASDGIEPGQFQGLDSFAILKDGRGLGFEIVNGIGKLVWFDKGMRYAKTTLPKDPNQVISSIIPYPDGGGFGASFMTVDPQQEKILLRTGLLDNNFKPLKVLTENFRPGFDASRVRDLSYWVSYMANGFKTSHGGKGIVAVDERGAVFTAITNQYAITKWSPDLKSPDLVIKREYEPIPRTKEDIDAAVKIQTARIRSSLPQSLRPMIIESLVREAYLKADLGPVKNPIFGLLTMPEGYLLVVHDFRAKDHEDLADIFDETGKYVGRVGLRRHGLLGTNGLPRMSFREGMAYTIHTDSEGRHQAVRYRYRIVAE